MTTITLDYAIDPKPRWGYGCPAHPQLTKIIAAARPTIAKTLESCLVLDSHFDAIRGREDPASARPGWDNGWFPCLDAIVLTTMLVNRRPARMVEVGSGNSTKFARLAIESFGLPTRITSIDPQPRAEVDALCDHVIRAGLETADPVLFDQLEPGDVLFLDGSHRAFQNSDVAVFFTEVLPRLAPGVIVQLHDIYLPWDYVADWAERFYNEQYLLACWLLAAPERVDLLAANFYTLVDDDLRSRVAPLWRLPSLADVAMSGGSFWFRLKY